MVVSTARLRHLAPEHAVRFVGHDRHEHDEPHLIYVAVGMAHLEVDDATMTLRAHESLWLAPHVPHSARYEPGSLVLGPLLSPRSTPPARAMRLGVIPQITDIMTTILGVAPSTEAQIAELREALDASLAALVSVALPTPAPTHPIAAAVAREALRSPSTLGELAAKHGTSARHLQRVFLAETGLPFGRWRVRARLNAAIALLRSGVTVDRAARAAGYATRSGLVKAMHRELDAQVVGELLDAGYDRAFRRSSLPSERDLERRGARA